MPCSTRKNSWNTADEGSPKKTLSRRDFLEVRWSHGRGDRVGGGLGGLVTACGGGSTTTTAAREARGRLGPQGPHSPRRRGGPYVSRRNPSAPTWAGRLTFSGGGDLVQAYYETLLRSDEKGNLKPWLAESYKVADDQKSITFTIRKGVKFTDGSDLTADVVKWNLEQYAKSETTWASVDVVDPNTVRVNFKAWDNTLPAAFGDAQPALYMVSKAAYDKNGQAWITTHPVGTGPFTVASLRSGCEYEAGEEPELLGQGQRWQQAARTSTRWITPSRLTPRPR